VPFNCVIERVTLAADQVGSIQVDIWKSTYAPSTTDAGSITGGHEPEISGSNKGEDASLTAGTTLSMRGISWHLMLTAPPALPG
jgi:hypothetical protein